MSDQPTDGDVEARKAALKVAYDKATSEHHTASKAVREHAAGTAGHQTHPCMHMLLRMHMTLRMRMPLRMRTPLRMHMPLRMHITLRMHIPLRMHMLLRTHIPLRMHMLFRCGRAEASCAGGSGGGGGADEHEVAQDVHG